MRPQGLSKRWAKRAILCKEGDNVVLSWTPACGVCSSCVRGEVHLCLGINMTTEGRGPLSIGGVGLDRFMGLGAFSEHVVVPEAMAVPVSSMLKASHTCLIGCGVTTGFGAAVNTAAVRWGESVTVTRLRRRWACSNSRCANCRGSKCLRS